MNYSINYSNEAKQDIYSIHKYITEQLSAPDAAAKQLRHIMDEVEKLDALPFRHPLYEEEPWHSKGLRFFPVDNHLVFYLPNKDSQKVYILRIMYGKRDLSQQLKSK